jgi:hypothetical protein
MLPANYPPYPPVLLIALMFAVQVGFGFLYNWIFRWIRIPVPLAVVIGTFITGAIMYPFFFSTALRGEQWLFLTLIAFAGSGTPMALLSVKRTNDARESHRRRPWPTAALRVRDEALSSLSMIIHDVKARTNDSRIDAAFLVNLVDGLYEIIGMLKSV